jgi:hypothetical protein
MTGYVLDEGVAVKSLVTEAFSDEAARLLDKGPTPIVPELLFAEPTNAPSAQPVLQPRGAPTRGLPAGRAMKEKGLSGTAQPLLRTP